MKPISQNGAETGGGPVAIRGFLVQTLVALLDITQSDPPFTEITLEPAPGDEQFDFLWSDGRDAHATQVKSTRNSFTKSDVVKWAKKLQAARTNEQCRLMLVGKVPPGLDGLKSVGEVVVETKNLHLDDLIEQAAQRLAKFLEREQQNAGTAEDREMVVHALVSKLQNLSTTAKPLSREAFVGLLTRWVREAPRQSRLIDISRIVKYAPAELIGREAETKLLDDAWAKVQSGEPKRPHVLTFVALGGEGKTSLVAKWAAELAHQDWPGCDAAFAWSFYSQGTREQVAASSDLFLKEALTFFGDDADKQFAASPAGAFEKGQRLARIVGQRRSLLILDGLEPLQYAPTAPTPGQLKDQGIAALLKGLAAASHGLCVVTTRYSLPDLRAFWQTTSPEVVLRRLSRAAGVHLLQSCGVKGSLLRNIPFHREQVNEFEKLVEDVQGHALTLNLLGTYLRDAHAGDIRKRDLVKLEEADAEEQGGHAFRVMEAYVRWFQSDGDRGYRSLAVLRCLGLFDRPATADCLDALQKAPVISGMTKGLVDINEAACNLTLARLEKAGLLSVNRNAAGALVSLDAHALLKEFFARERMMQHPEAWRTAHRRIYEHLASTSDKPEPTLEELEPLYQAVAHGCQANLRREAFIEVYSFRILRVPEFYSSKKLGALGNNLAAVACFFDTPWSRVSAHLNQDETGSLLHEAAYYLRALGRLSEAVEPMRAGRKISAVRPDQIFAARSASSLSELELTLGDVKVALETAIEVVTWVDRCGDMDARAYARTAYGDALHQAGRLAEAEECFRETEALVIAHQRASVLLFSVPGFKYCDLLLTAPERAAWRTFDTKHVEQRSSLLACCETVSKRAAQTLKEYEEHADASLLEIALDHLTSARVTLYTAILNNLALEACHALIQQAISGLRQAGTVEFLACGLLTRAWLRVLTDQSTSPESAKADLDEAWEIAERGPMRLHMADIHLHRARLFFREAQYPWESPQADLAAAEKLINNSGYHRRDEELADAKAAILSK